MLARVPYRSITHRFLACLLVFSIVNCPLWALDISDVSWMLGASHNTGAPADTLSFIINNRGIIDWSKMNVNMSDAINTLQFTGSPNFAVLNRVQSAVNFNGILDAAGGKVWIVSPYGIVIGPQALISAKSFIASGLDISNENFLAGHYQFVPFEIEGVKMIGAVTNEGKIGYNPDGSPNPVEYAALIGSQVLNKGAILADGDLVVLASGDEIFLSTEGSDVMVTLYETPVADNTYNVTNTGSITNSAGSIVLAAGDTFAQAITGIQDKAYTMNTFTASQQGELIAPTVEIAAANQADTRQDSTTLANEIKIAAKKVMLEETLKSDGTLTIDADYDIDAQEGIESVHAMNLIAKTIQVSKDIISGSIAEIQADKLYSEGDVISEDDLLLMAESVLWGDSHQKIHSDTSVKSTGAITKITAGNLYISATENVQLDGDVAAEAGGVSVIAETGIIYSDDTDTLNVAIRGYSDDITDSIGVELPDGDGKAAIVLKSSNTLKLGPEASLTADGFYLSVNDNGDIGVDDRPGINWLADDGEIIGGYERDEGIASDVAIYVGSETGNVEVATADIETPQPGNSKFTGDEMEVVSGPATVVLDAYDTVKMPSVENIEQQRQEQENDNLFRFRLEVASRITEWLIQAIQDATLPYAATPQAVEQTLGYDYVLRGAGLDNSKITDGRAWVLENPPVPVAPLPELEQPELQGCPAELQAAAKELDINTDDLQISVQKAMATNPNLQPCDACARLLVAADALQDVDGSRFAALVEIFERYAPLDRPFTPEDSTLITMALATQADQDPLVALADDYIDAFVDYIAVLNDDLKTPIGDPLVYTLNKYGQPIMNHPNQNIVSFIVAQVQERG